MYAHTMPLRSCVGYATALTLSLKSDLGRLVGHVDAAAVDVELPAVVDAAQSFFFIAAEEQRRAAVRAVVGDQAELVARGPERDQVLAEEAQAHWCRRRVLAARSARKAGSQYSRMNAPMGVPGPTRQRSSLSSVDNMAILGTPTRHDIRGGGSPSPNGALLSDDRVPARDAPRRSAERSRHRPSRRGCRGAPSGCGWRRSGCCRIRSASSAL